MRYSSGTVGMERGCVQDAFQSWTAGEENGEKTQMYTGNQESSWAPDFPEDPWSFRNWRQYLPLKVGMQVEQKTVNGLNIFIRSI